VAAETAHYAVLAGSQGDFLPLSPPADKATACQDQAGKTSTGDGAGDRRGRIISEECEVGPRFILTEVASHDTHVEGARRWIKACHAHSASASEPHISPWQRGRIIRDRIDIQPYQRIVIRRPRDPH